MRILGCDYSTHYVDFVAIEDGNPPVWTRYELLGNDSFDRARSVHIVLPTPGQTYWDDVLAIGIEEPAGRNTGHLFRIQGGVINCIPAQKLVEKWMPSQWRKAVGIAGNASKEDVTEYVLRNGFSTGWKTDQTDLAQDACDAYCIAVATRQAIRQEGV